MNQRKAGVFLSYLLIIINTVVNLMYVPILLHYMGTNEYGLYRLMGSLIAYFSLMDFGLSSTVTRFYARYRALSEVDKMENLLAISLLLYCGVAILLTSVGGVFYFLIDRLFSESMTVAELVSAKAIYILLLLNILFTFSGHVFTAVITAHEKFVFLKGFMLFQVIFQPFVVIAVIAASPYALSLVLVQSGFNLVLVAAKIFYSFQRLQIKIKYHFFDRTMFQSMLNFSMGIFTVAIVDQIYWQTNQIILGIISGTAIVAVYAVAAQIYMNYMSLSSVVSSVFLTRITEIVTSGNAESALTELFIKIGRIQFLLLALVLSGFILYGQEFIALWVGNEFADAYWITLLIIAPFTVDLIQNIGLSIMQAKNQYGFRAKVHLCMGIFNLILAFPMAYWYGGIGCAFITGMMMFIGDGIIMNLYYKKVVQIDIYAFWRQIFGISLVVIVCTGIGFLFRSIDVAGLLENFLLKLILYVATYLLMIWHYAMNDYEKGIFLQVVKKIKLFKMLGR